MEYRRKNYQVFSLYQIRTLLLKFSCVLIIISTALSPLRFAVKAAENIHYAPVLGESIPPPVSDSRLLNDSETASNNQLASPSSSTIKSPPLFDPTPVPPPENPSDFEGPDPSPNQNLSTTVFAQAKIEASLEPAIYLSDKPLTLKWRLPNWTPMEPGETRHMLIAFPVGSENHILNEKEIDVPVSSPSGSVSFTIPSTVMQVVDEADIYIKLFKNDQLVGETSLSIGHPDGTFEGSLAKSIPAFNGKISLLCPPRLLILPWLLISARLTDSPCHPFH